MWLGEWAQGQAKQLGCELDDFFPTRCWPACGVASVYPGRGNLRPPVHCPQPRVTIQPTPPLHSTVSCPYAAGVAGAGRPCVPRTLTAHLGHPSLLIDLSQACLRRVACLFSADDGDANPSTANWVACTSFPGMFGMHFGGGCRTHRLAARRGQEWSTRGLRLEGWQLDFSAMADVTFLAKGLLEAKAQSGRWGVFCVWWGKPQTPHRGQKRSTSYRRSDLRSRWSLLWRAACLICHFRRHLLSLPPSSFSPPSLPPLHRPHQTQPTTTTSTRAPHACLLLHLLLSLLHPGPTPPRRGCTSSPPSLPYPVPCAGLRSPREDRLLLDCSGRG